MTNPYVDKDSEITDEDYGNPLLTKGPDGDMPGDAWFQGIPAFEDGEALIKAIAERDFIGTIFGVQTAALDVLGATFDPIGTVASYIASWMLDHVTPLRMALDGLAGNPAVVRAYAATWANVSTALFAAHGDLTARIDAETATWQGLAAHRYRGSAHGVAKLLGASGAAAKAMSAIVMMMGELVAAVRKNVRDVIAILAGELVNATIELTATVGLAAGLVADQVALQISRCVQRVSKTLADMALVMSEVLICADATKRLLEATYKSWKASPFA
jgi:uncharacterized protein YukE